MSISGFATPPAPTQPILVDPREAARLLSISERKLWDLTFHQEILSLKIGRCVRYRIVDLHGWAATQAQSVSSAADANAGEPNDLPR